MVHEEQTANNIHKIGGIIEEDILENELCYLDLNRVMTDRREVDERMRFSDTSSALVTDSRKSSKPNKLLEMAKNDLTTSIDF